MNKKIILFLLEGQSDLRALEYPLALFFNAISKNIECICLTPQNGKSGDITGESSVNQKEILKIIPTWWNISYNLSIKGLEATDVLEIVHIVDSDGTYIPNENIQFYMGEKAEYLSDGIKHKWPERIIDRNTRKKRNLTTLKNSSTISIGTTKVNYSIFYFSCNLDHYLSGNRNISVKDKFMFAEKFSIKIQTHEDLLNYLFSNDNPIKKHHTIKESWEWLGDLFNSLRFSTNLGLCLIKYLNDMVAT